MKNRPKLHLYGREWCHLCDDMHVALIALAKELAFDLVYFDVDADPALEARYDELVPVLTRVDANGETPICHYLLDEVALRLSLSPVGQSHQKG